ncbi:hypothetical protein ACUHMQ_03640 [Chitinimonas sp. PSY-7]|uniref:hypothetical protein n=1 Tax=Chitinimonas sp. PSY-7 TaxID=3459088 RepID=UPI0040401BBF
MAYKFEHEVVREILKATIADQNPRNTDTRSPWYSLSDEALNEYTKKVITHLERVQDSSLTIAHAIALESKETEDLSIEARQGILHHLIDKQNQSLANTLPSDPAYTAKEKRLADLQDELQKLDTVKEGFELSNNHAEAEAKAKARAPQELTLPNHRFHDIGTDQNPDRVRVYMAVYAPYIPGSQFKDLILDDKGQLDAKSNQLWIGAGTPYKALGWLQKYQLDNNKDTLDRKNKNANGSEEFLPGQPMIRSVEVNRAFFDRHLPEATPEGGVRYNTVEGINEPRLAYVDVKSFNQLGLDTTTQDISGNTQQSALMRSFLENAHPKTLETISFRHNLRSRPEGIDGKRVDVQNFMKDLGISVGGEGPSVYLFDRNNTMFHTYNDDKETWQFSTTEDQIKKVKSLQGMLTQLEQMHSKTSSLSLASDGFETPAPEHRQAPTVAPISPTSSRMSDDIDSGYLADTGSLSGSDRRSLSSSQSDSQSDRGTGSDISAQDLESRASEERNFSTNESEDHTVAASPDYEDDRHPDALDLFYSSDADIEDHGPTLPLKVDLGSDENQATIKSFGEFLAINHLTPGALVLPAKDISQNQRDTRGDNLIKVIIEDEIATQLLKDRSRKLNNTVNGLIDYLEKGRTESIANLDKNIASTGEQLSRQINSKSSDNEYLSNQIDKNKATLNQAESERDRLFQTSPLIQKVLKNQLVQNDLMAISRNTGEKPSAELFINELRKFARGEDLKTTHLGANLFFHSLRIVAQEINQTPGAIRPDPIPHKTIAGTDGNELDVPVNNRLQKIDYSALLNQTPQASGLPFDIHRSTATYVPNPKKDATVYMNKLDTPFKGGISGTTRDICKALPTIAPDLPSKEKNDLFLLNAAFMVKNQYHSMFEALYPVARYDTGNMGKELLKTFDECRDNNVGLEKKSNTELYQRTLSQMTGSTELWNTTVKEIDTKLQLNRNLIEPPTPNIDGVALNKFKREDDASRFKVSDIQYDKQFAILSLNAQQRDPNKSRCYVPLSDLSKLPSVGNQITMLSKQEMAEQKKSVKR